MVTKNDSNEKTIKKSSKSNKDQKSKTASDSPTKITLPPRPAVIKTVVELDKEKVGVTLSPYEIWFSIRKKKPTAFRAMRVFAQKRLPTMMATLEDWDKLFERF